MYYLRQFLEMLTYPLRALLSTPSRLFSGSRRLWAISLPARLAWLLAIALFIVAIVSVIALYYTEEHTWVWNKYAWGYNLVVVALMIVIPIVFYITLKLWLEGEISPFPDIDHAWKAGLAELQQHAIDLSQTPLFLVLGQPPRSRRPSGDKDAEVGGPARLIAPTCSQASLRREGA